MCPPSVLPNVDEHTPDVPGILKRLVRVIAYTFYQPCHIAIFNVLLRHVVVDEDSLSLLVKIDKKQLRSMIVQLRADKLIRHRIMKEKMEDTGQFLSFTYYYINYHLFLNIIKYKLECMKRKIVHQEDSDRLRPNYTCSNCTKGFTDLDMSRLINMKTGELSCYMCHQPVYENEESKQQVMNRTLLAKFNQQFNYLYKLIDKCCTVEFDEKLLEPPILRSHVDRAVLSRNSLDVNVLDMFQVDRNPNARTKRLLTNTSYQQQLTVKFDDDSNEQNNEAGSYSSLLAGDSKNKTKKFPEWLKPSHLDLKSDNSGKSMMGTFSQMDPSAYNNDGSLMASSNNNNDDQEMMDDIDELLRLEETGATPQDTNKVASATNPTNDFTSTNFDHFEIDDLMDGTDNSFKRARVASNDNYIDIDKVILEEIGSSSAITNKVQLSLDDITKDLIDRMTDNDRRDC